MNLYLVRHGDAKSQTQDPERSLTLKGMRRIRLLAEMLRERNASPLVFYHSTKKRALQTAEILRDELAPDVSLISSEYLKPSASPELILPEILSLSDDAMLVGHLPHIQILSGMLASDFVGTFRTGSTAWLTGSVREEWKMEEMIHIPDENS